ncbi:condensation domain-containing protein [Streptomyces sp. HUAS TT3]|uniref:condensation domain-containing protein n=1 Tax=Streptomyces sp. HUAS TT3 TaxID=3447510 RepID=UPI003F6568E7
MRCSASGFRLSPTCHLWHQGYHHLVMDAYGCALVRQRVTQTYTALAEGRKVPQCAFGSLDDLVAADAEYRTSTQFVTDRAYWMERFADRPAPHPDRGPVSRRVCPVRAPHRRVGGPAHHCSASTPAAASAGRTAGC